jgi:hypothetical protein
MTFTNQRRRDPVGYTPGWEVAVAVLAGGALVIGLAALLGIGLAALLFGGGWVWPHGTGTIGAVVGGLISGHPGHGLVPLEAKRVPGAAVVYVCVAVVELLFIAVVARAGALIVRRFRNDGMATRGEAQQALGTGLLHEAKAVIRPDLYGRDRGRRGEEAP